MGIIDELKPQARDLEKELEKCLEELEKLQIAINPDDFEVSFDKQPEVKLQSVIERLLAQLKHISDQMQKSATSQIEKSTANTYSVSQKTSQKRYHSVKAAIENKRWQQELLGKQIANGESTKIDVLIKEEKSLDQSLDISQKILNAAHEVKISLAYQSKKLNSTSDKIVKFAETLPGINFLMKKISSRKKLNAAVIGLAVGICACIVIYKIF